MADRLNLCFLDLETTGHDPVRKVGLKLEYWHEIVEMGVLVADAESQDVLGEWEIKVRPEKPERCLVDLVNDYPKRALAGEWDGAVNLDAAIIRLLRFCGGFGNELILAGHNFSFDWSFLNIALARSYVNEEAWRSKFHYSRLDIKSMAMQELNEPDAPYNPGNYSLRNQGLADRLGIPMETYPHCALNGARQAYLVYKKLNELKRLRWHRPEM